MRATRSESSRTEFRWNSSTANFKEQEQRSGAGQKLRRITGTQEGPAPAVCSGSGLFYSDFRLIGISWGVRGDLRAAPPRRGKLITAHIIGLRPRKTKLLPKPGLSPSPCKQRRRSASRLRSRAVKLHGFRTSACCRHEDLEKPLLSN